MATKKLTTKKTETLTSKTKEDPERHLIKGANILMKGFGTPGKFLSFLTNALHSTSIEGVSEEKGTDRTFFLRIITTEVLQMWIGNDERINEKIAIGLKEVWECFGYDEYFAEIAIIIKGMAASISKEGCPTKKYLDEYFKGVGIMLEVGDCIQAYEYEINKIGEQNRSSEAA